MIFRKATSDDLDLLAQWNEQLIVDEGHRNPMSLAELRERMQGWLSTGYQSMVFSNEKSDLGYALYRESESEVYLRQFFVARHRRRQGLGRKAIRILIEEVWPREKRLTVDVLMRNPEGIAFWRAVGYIDHCLTLEIAPRPPATSIHLCS